jgi:acetylglutamate kinase
MKNVIVIKIGGSTFGSGDTTLEDLVSLQKQGESMVVVHGGGNVVTSWLKRQGIAAHFVRGERVTDAPTLEVVTAVLAGLVNKELVAAINVLGGRAVGLSGVDGVLLAARIKNQELGYVGAVEKVNVACLEALLEAGFMPVVSPIGLHSVGLSEGAPQLVNINGDPVAGELAVALGAKKLIFLTDTCGVCDKSGNTVPALTVAEAHELIASGVIAGGMIPKVEACLRALTVGAESRIVDGRPQRALIGEIEGRGVGTTLHGLVD